MMSSERLQKILSQAGFGSRREMERWIEAGLVHVNGLQAKLGDGATAEDKISVKGRIIANPKFLKTVFDNLPHLKQGRWVQVGRLDLNTSGLLIFTNNGELANRLMHPKYELEREYAVRVHGTVLPETINTLLRGVMLDDGIAKFKRVEFRGGEGTNSWYHVILSEGRNREVRRLWESQGLEVSRLIRIRYGQLPMPRSLARGDFVELSIKEVDAFVAKLS